MFVLSNLVGALATIIDIALLLYMIALFAVVVVSWFAPRSVHPAVMFLRSITHPVLAWLRRKFPFTVQGGFDLSPMIAFFAIYFIQRFLVASLYQWAARLE
ncbi:MAG TPA: YggT family protein [bacterium]|nr:YggT family protein [bacterium]